MAAPPQEPAGDAKELEILTSLTSDTLRPLTPEQVVDQLIQSEEVYVKSVLEVAIRSFEKRLRNRVEVGKPIITEAEINSIFLNLDAIYEFNKQFLEELTRLKYEGSVIENLGSRIIQFIPFFKVYSTYLRGHKQAASVFIGLAKNAKFAKFLKFNQLSAGVKLAALLALPVSRLPQYLVYLGAMMEKVDDDQAKEDISVAISKIQEVTNLITEKVKDTTARQMVVTLQTQVFNNLIQIVEPSRFVVKQGSVKQVLPKRAFQISKTKKVLLVCFNDMILWGAPGKQVQKVFRLENVEVVDIDDSSGLKDAFGIRESRGKVLFVAPSDAEKKSWVDEIKQYAQTAKLAAATQKPVDPILFEKIIMKKSKKTDLVIGAARLPPGASGAAPVAADTEEHEDEMFVADDEMKAAAAAAASEVTAAAASDASYSGSSGAYGDYSGYYGSSYYGSEAASSTEPSYAEEKFDTIAPTFSDYGPIDGAYSAASTSALDGSSGYASAGYYGGYTGTGFSDESSGYAYDPATGTYYPTESYTGTAATGAQTTDYAALASYNFQSAVAAYDAASAAYEYAGTGTGAEADYEDYGAGSGGWTSSTGGGAEGWTAASAPASSDYSSAPATSDYSSAPATSDYSSAAPSSDYSSWGAAADPSGGWTGYDSSAYGGYYGYQDPAAGSAISASGVYASGPSASGVYGAPTSGPSTGGATSASGVYSAAPSGSGSYGSSTSASGVYGTASGYSGYGEVAPTASLSYPAESYGGSSGYGAPTSGPKSGGFAVSISGPESVAASGVYRPTPVIKKPAELQTSGGLSAPTAPTSALASPTPSASGFGFVIPGSEDSKPSEEVKKPRSLLPKGPNPLALAAIAKLKTPRAKDISKEEKEMIMKAIESDPEVKEMVMKDAELKEMIMAGHDEPTKPEKPIEKRGSGKREDIVQRGDFLRKSDPKSGRFYYVNIKTKASQWQPPPEFAEDKLPPSGAPAGFGGAALPPKTGSSSSAKPDLSAQYQASLSSYKKAQ